MRRLLRWLLGVGGPVCRPPVLEHQSCGHPLAARAIRGAVTVCWACEVAAQ